jgi:hypothetical protein
VAAEDRGYEGIDAVLAGWRQGDITLDAGLVFLHLADLARPITAEARETSRSLWPDGPPPHPDPGAVFAEAPGFVVLTQTCDIVRPSSQRPYLEIAPLVPVDTTVLEEVRRLRRPGFAYVPLAAPQRLVADLDRTMTIEKAVVVGWRRQPGWTTDEEARAFAEALARKRARFAFPDDFVAAIQKLQDRLAKRHNKSHAEGAHLRALREIRVRAAPSWDDETVELTFWFIKDGDPVGYPLGWSSWIEEWAGLFDQTGRYRIEAAIAVRLQDITAQDYVESDRLDLDQLSTSRRG